MATTTMEAYSSSSLCRVSCLWTVGTRPRQMKSTASFVSPGRRRRSNGLMISNRRLRTPSALGELADTVAETGKSEITWQIIVGTIGNYQLGDVINQLNVFYYANQLILQLESHLSLLQVSNSAKE